MCVVCVCMRICACLFFPAQKYDSDTIVMHVNMGWYSREYISTDIRNMGTDGAAASRELGILSKGLLHYLGPMAGGTVPPQVVVTILGAFHACCAITCLTHAFPRFHLCVVAPGCGVVPQLSLY